VYRAERAKMDQARNEANMANREVKERPKPRMLKIKKSGEDSVDILRDRKRNGDEVLDDKNTRQSKKRRLNM
jgi:hypothetical protein